MKSKQHLLSEPTEAVIYCRVSSERQVSTGHGLDSQEQRCLRRADDRNLKVAAIFRDEGVSGGLFERPAMQELIKFLDDHPNQRYVIIFDDLSRFARDLKVHLQLKTELGARGAVMECLNLNLDDTDEGELVEMMMASVAQYDRKRNRRQVIQKMTARLQSGYWTFNPPPGLKNMKNQNGDRLLVADQPIAGIYKSAIEKYRDYELNTLQDVASYITNARIANGLQMKPMSLHGAKAVLEEPLYAGYLEYQPWDVPFMKAKHDGFISLETYQTVQARLLNKAKPRLRKDYSYDFPMRNFVLCDDCKKPMTAAWFKGNGGRYAKYQCKSKACPQKGKTFARDKVENSFKELLRDLKPHADILRMAKKVLEDMWKRRVEREEEFKKGIDAEIAALENQNQLLLERSLSTTNPKNIKAYEDVIAKNSSAVQDLKQKLLQKKYRDDGFQTALGLVTDYMKEPEKQWLKPNYQSKRVLLGLYFEHGLSYSSDRGFQTNDLPLILAVSNQKTASKAALVEMAGVKPASKTNFSLHCSQD